MRTFPKVGEYWYRADGSKDGITILDVAHWEKGERIATALSADERDGDPWIEYRYDSGQISEKNWCGFMARFMPTKDGWPKS